MNSDTLLHRQVHPAWVQQGTITSQVFRPTPKDEKHLSVYDGDQITAELSWWHFTRVLKHESVGVMAVTIGECEKEELTVAPDPEPFPEHVFVDFSAYGENQIKKKAKRLKAVAEVRGWQYRVEARG